MKTLKQPFILFFLAGMVPTPAELIEAAKIRGRVGMRNASVVSDEHVAEPCDGVAGSIPTPYKKLPTAAQAIAAYDAKVEQAAKSAAALVDKPPTRKPASAGGGIQPPPAPKGFEGLPGGDGSVGAPAAPAATGDASTALPADTAPPAPSTPPAPAADAGKPPAWPSAAKTK